MTTPLYVYPFDRWSEVRDVFRRAKQSDPQLRDVMLQPMEATPGCDHLLALGGHPPFIAEYALISRGFAEKPDAEDLCRVILGWYCGLADDKRIITHEQWLSRVLGREVKETHA